MTQKDSVSTSKKTNNGISIIFNGKTTSLNTAREAIAATDHDRMKNWREEETALESKIEETAPSIEDETVTNKGPLDWRGLEGSVYDNSEVISLSSTNRPKASGGNNFVLFIRKFWVPFFSAVIVGLGLGFTVLLVLSSNHNTMVSSDKAVQTTAKPSLVQPSAKQMAKQSVQTVSGTPYLLNLQEVQTGFFDTKSSALSEQSSESSKGVHAVVLNDGGGYALISGVALKQADLTSLDQILPQSVNVYNKPFAINPSKMKGTTRELQDIKTANLVIQNLIPLSLTAIQNGTVDQLVLKKVDKALSQMQDPSGGMNQKDLVKLKGTLVAAYSALNQSQPNGQNAQHAILDAIESYQTVILAREQ